MVIERQCRAVYGRRVIFETVFQLLLYGSYVAYHGVVAGICHVGYPIIYPECRCPREVVHRAVFGAETERYFGHAAIHGDVDAGIGIIDTEPLYAAYGIGQITAHLSHQSKSGLLGGDGTLIEIGLAIDFERRGTETVRRIEGATAYIVVHIVGCAVEVVAHGVFHFAQCKFTRGTYIEGEGRLALTFEITQILVHIAVITTEETPYAGFATAQCAIVEYAVSLGEAEIFVDTVEVSLFTGKRYDIGRIEAILGVVEGELMDAGMVGVSRYAVVGYAYGYPYGALATGAFAYQFHNPRLIGVGYGERLAAAVITVLFHQVGHHLNSLAGGACTFQS